MAVEPDVTEWPYHIPDSGINFREALNLEEEAVRAFDSGSEDFAVKFNEFVHTGMWGMKKVRRYQFATADGTVGFACVRFVREKHPTMAGPDKAIYLQVLGFGLNVAFQKRRDPDSPANERFSDLVMGALEAMAREGTTETGAEDVAGLSLWVLEDNEHAQKFYGRFGYRFDESAEAESIRAAKGARVMRMLF